MTCKCKREAPSGDGARSAGEPIAVALEDTLLDILDLSTGWCSPLSDADRLRRITEVGTAALRNRSESRKVREEGGSFSLLAYRRDNPFDGGHDLRRTRLPLTRLDAAVRWALQRGCDTILIELGDDPAIRDRGVTHHVCSDAACPGGC